MKLAKQEGQHAKLVKVEAVRMGSAFLGSGAIGLPDGSGRIVLQLQRNA